MKFANNNQISASTTAYHELAAAIVLQAVKDYRTARKFILKHMDEYPPDRMGEILLAMKKRKTAERVAYKKEHGKLKGFKFVPTRDERMAGQMKHAFEAIEEVEEFICSDWYGKLTDIDPQLVLKQLRTESYDDSEEENET